jgi:hypothetical protein
MYAGRHRRTTVLGRPSPLVPLLTATVTGVVSGVVRAACEWFGTHWAS